MKIQMQYKPISIRFLQEGMILQEDICVMRDGAVVPVVKGGTLLSPALIEKLEEETLESKNIYLGESTYQYLLGIGLLKSPAQIRIEIETGYDESKTYVKRLLRDTQESGIINIRFLQDAAEDIFQKLRHLDTGAFLQCIHGVRDTEDYLYTHSTNVGMLNALIASWAELSEAETEKLIKVGILHDIGKLMIPEEILSKPGLLTMDEFTVMQKHPVYGCEIMERSGIVEERIMRGVFEHHERSSGKGYPRQLPAQSICRYAKITAIADVYDAMITRKTYRKEHSPFAVMETFQKQRVSDLDFELVNLFLKKLSVVLKGKNVILSDGSAASVIFIDTTKYEYPLVEREGSVFQTDSKIKVERMIV